MIITSIILFEVAILEMQKRISPKFFMPRCLKGNPFNYFQDITLDIIKTNNYNTECIICLDDLVKDNNQTVDNNKDPFSYKDIPTRFKKWLESMKRTHITKPYMITPCKHVFHTPCLESWMNRKNECPFCRRSIPPLE
jgi:hypothetical protein